jgi:hypothetical protein
LSKKYGELNSDYDKLGAAYKSLNEANDASREMSARVIVDLEERIKQMRSTGGGEATVSETIVSTAGTPVAATAKAKRKKRKK